MSASSKATIALGAASGAFLAHAVRGRSSAFFGPSVWHGDVRRRTLALTFDDGPSEATPEILAILREHNIPATFFVCGANVRRLPAVARAIRDAGHEIGNHSDTHPHFHFKSAAFIENEFTRAQQTIEDVLNVRPSLLRAPFGVRWFGFRAMQRKLGLLGVMWTVIGRDWCDPAATVTARVLNRAGNGGILCLHDGRELRVNPDVSSTIEAVRIFVPRLLEQGYRFQTVSQLLAADRLITATTR